MIDAECDGAGPLSVPTRLCRLEHPAEAAVEEGGGLAALGQLSSTDMMLPPGSVNQAIAGPCGPRAMPLSSWSKPS